MLRAGAHAAPLGLGIACCCFASPTISAAMERGGLGVNGTSVGDRASCGPQVPCPCSSQPSSHFSSSSPPRFSPENRSLSWKVLQLEEAGARRGGSQVPLAWALRTTFALLPGASSSAWWAAACALLSQAAACLCLAVGNSTAACARPTSCPSHCARFQLVTYGTGYIFIIIFMQCFPYFFCSVPISFHVIPPLSLAKVFQACVYRSPCKTFQTPFCPVPF